VIPTYRRRNHLLDVLQMLSKQAVQPDEVIVIDCSPAQEALSEADLQSLPPWLVYRRPQIPHGNISAQRNLALRRSRGDIILFLDDDVEFDAGLISAHLDVLAATGAHAISGLVLRPGRTPISGPLPFHAPKIQFPGGPNFQLSSIVHETFVVCTANFSVRRTALAKVGGFDEQLSGTRDDVDLGIRLQKAGFTVLHHPAPSVLHLMVDGSGSRSADLALEWSLTNLFYFQFKHFWEDRRTWLLLRTYWDYCRPSRLWLTPSVVVNRVRAVGAAYQLAQKKEIEGALHGTF
jgi:GT2 family glycosyltransferase